MRAAAHAWCVAGVWARGRSSPYAYVNRQMTAVRPRRAPQITCDFTCMRGRLSSQAATAGGAGLAAAVGAPHKAGRLTYHLATGVTVL